MFSGLPKLSFPYPVLLAFIGAYAILLLATAIVWYLRREQPQRDFTELRLRIKTWWWIVGLTTIALGFNRYIAILCISLVSFLAFKEYLTLIPTRRADHRVLFWAYLAIPIQYALVAVEWYGVFIIFIPV